MHLWWLDFGDGTGCLVQGRTFANALDAAHALGLPRPAYIAGYKVKPTQEAEVRNYWPLGKLLSREQIAGLEGDHDDREAAG